VKLYHVKYLGYGGSSTVDEVGCPNIKETFARKTIRARPRDTSRVRTSFLEEIKITRKLKHQHIVRAVASYELGTTSLEFNILLEPVAETDLHSWMERAAEKQFVEADLEILNRWYSCLANTVEYIHKNVVRHKDLKPSNVLVKGTEIWITDFGSAREFSSTEPTTTDGTGRGFTRLYSAPEVIMMDKRGRKSDVFSLGCIFAEMATVSAKKSVPNFKTFRKRSTGFATADYHATLTSSYEWLKRLQDPRDLSAENDDFERILAPGSLEQLIIDMMAKDPDDRPAMDEVTRRLAKQHQIPNCRLVCSPVNLVPQISAALNVRILHGTTRRSRWGKGRRVKALVCRELDWNFVSSGFLSFVYREEKPRILQTICVGNILNIRATDYSSELAWEVVDETSQGMNEVLHNFFQVSPSIELEGQAYDVVLGKDIYEQNRELSDCNTKLKLQEIVRVQEDIGYG
jgi:serine/threonine protein kinase